MKDKITNKRILIDIGSSTVKVYKFTHMLTHLFSESLHFREGYTPEKGITQDKKKALYSLINDLKSKHKDYPIKTYATSIFRNMDSNVITKLKDEFFLETGVYLNVVSHDLENRYLQQSLVGKAMIDEPLLLINIGGGSTELVVTYDNEVLETHNEDIGVGPLLEKYKKINDQTAGHNIRDVVNDIKKKLPKLENSVRIAFYSGGELTYMQRAGYKLRPNVIFEDMYHPKIITFNNFVKDNQRIFSKVTIKELEEMMPENPKWMHGARICSAIAQAICEKYEIKTIIPSDTNLIHGVIRQEFRKVTLSGSFRKHLDYILAVRNILINKGTEVLSPHFTEPKNPGDEFVVFSGEEDLKPLELERHHLDSIENSDALIVCSKDGYVGASSMLEIGYANKIGKRIIFIEKPKEFLLNNLPCEMGL